MRRSSFSFRAHLAALGVLVAIPFIAAGAAISVLYARSEIVSTKAQLAGAAKEVSQVVDRHIETTIAALRALSFSPQLRDGDYGRFHEQARQTAALFVGGVVVLRRPDGQQIVNTAVDWGQPLPRSSDPLLREADERALRSDAPVISDLFVGAATGRFFIIVEFPVRIAESVFLLSAAVTPESVLRLLKSSPALKNENWRLVVIDRKARIIARTVQHDKYVGEQASPDFVARLVGQQGLLTSTTLDGVDVANGYFKSPLSGWTTIASLDAAAFYSPVRNSVFAISVIGICGLALSFLLAILYSRYLTPPIWRLREEALGLAAQRELAPFSTGISELNAVSQALASSSSALAEQRRANRTLVNELNHRVKNTLASVQAIAAQTLRGAGVDSSVREALESRLLALSAAHSTLTDQSWEGADIHQIIEQAISPHATADRVTLNGPKLRLAPRSAIAIAMAMHELATNAVKYGALSNETGSVSITWRVVPVVPPKIELNWKERDGPRVESPARRGFGSRLIERNVAHDLDGAAKIHFDAEGVVCTILGELGTMESHGEIQS